jgi:SAM-dependent methyltransferase
MAQWFENKAFWSELYPFLFPEGRLAAAEAEIEKIVRLIDFNGKAILDLGCGPGRHAVAFARKAYEVTGVDLSSFLLQKAKARARQAGVAVEWIRKDMRAFVRPRAFDLTISLFTSFGYFAAENDDLKVLRNVQRSLKTGGILVMDLLGKELLAKRFQATLSHELADGSLLIERHQIVGDWSRVRNEWIYLRKGKAKTFRFEVTSYSGQELKGRLREAGFKRIQLYGDLEGIEYGYDAKRLIAVAWK